MKQKQQTFSEVQKIQVGLASPERIGIWAERFLPNGKLVGQVTNANTLHHKTFKPQKGGLFCERIFGPVNDFECACGKRKRPPVDPENGRMKRLFCATCEVEYTWSRMRRYQMGLISLVSPVSHVWYVKGTPSWMSLILDMKRSTLESFLYCGETMTLEHSWNQRVPFSGLPDWESEWMGRLPEPSEPSTASVPAEMNTSSTDPLCTTDALDTPDSIQPKRFIFSSPEASSGDDASTTRLPTTVPARQRGYIHRRFQKTLAKQMFFNGSRVLWETLYQRDFANACLEVKTTSREDGYFLDGVSHESTTDDSETFRAQLAWLKLACTQKITELLSTWSAVRDEFRLKKQISTWINPSYEQLQPWLEPFMAQLATHLWNPEKLPFPLLVKPSAFVLELLGPGNVNGEEFESPENLKPRRKLKRKKVVVKNTIYGLSHRYGWENEYDWDDFATYMMPAIQAHDMPMPRYRHRLRSITQMELPTGAGLMQRLLRDFNWREFKAMHLQNRIFLHQLTEQILLLKRIQVEAWRMEPVLIKGIKTYLHELCEKRDLLMRRMKVMRKLLRKDSSPEYMILSVLPVLPPDLRPILKMQDQVTASDLNRLYQRILYRNERLKRFLHDPATRQSFETKYAQRLLQEAVDNLIENGKGGVTPERDARGRVLKSLSEVLKGKQGRFRQYLLGKRVDYSGRSVIVVGPQLRLHECGIPKEMALELFLPFLLKRILSQKLARTVVGAKMLIHDQPTLTHQLLEDILRDHPVLLNRAPTLHRLGFQAFQPKLVHGRAILLHPLVCPPFNADFDGDQMAVHVPITVEARVEAWKLMFSANNLLSPATGEPIILPSQDMVLGCYYLTLGFEFASRELVSGHVFGDVAEVVHAWQHGYIQLHTQIWMRWNAAVEDGNDPEEPFELQVHPGGHTQAVYKMRREYGFGAHRSSLIQTSTGRVLFHYMVQKNLKHRTVMDEKKKTK